MTPPTIRPIPDDLTGPFWEAARQHRLSIQHCNHCGQYNHPPQVVCSWCSSEHLEAQAVPPAGRIYSYTSALMRPSEGTGTPAHTNIVVELDVQEGVFLVGRVPGPRPAWLEIGRAVTARFDPLEGTDIVIPQFDPS